MKLECALKLKEQLKAEIQAYNTYNALQNTTEDEFLKDALDEIMYDEYLHAKFIRSYLMSEDMYDIKQHADLESMFMKIVEH